MLPSVKSSLNGSDSSSLVVNKPIVLMDSSSCVNDIGSSFASIDESSEGD